jgi:hypothetical protein
MYPIPSWESDIGSFINGKMELGAAPIQFVGEYPTTVLVMNDPSLMCILSLTVRLFVVKSSIVADWV